jgi:hypothetical protein
MSFGTSWDTNQPFGGEPTGMRTATNQWAFDGTYVNTSNQACSVCSVDWTKTSGPLTNDPTTAYWVSGTLWPGATYSASLAKSLFFTNGQQEVVSEKGLFSMIRPLPNFIAKVTGQVYADSGNYYTSDTRELRGGTWLHFGIASSIANEGVNLGYTNAPHNPATGTTFGTYSLTQVITGWVQQYNRPNANNVCIGYQVRGGPGLDSGIDSLGDGSEADNFIWGDSPGAELTIATWLYFEQSFSAFWMFTSPVRHINCRANVPSRLDLARERYQLTLG